jgi:hypothetical protein
VYVLLIVVFPFVLFLLAVVLSVLRQYTDSDQVRVITVFTVFRMLTVLLWEIRLSRKEDYASINLCNSARFCRALFVFKNSLKIPNKGNRSLVLYVCFVDRCLSFCTFSYGHCVVCSSSIYGL